MGKATKDTARMKPFSYNFPNRKFKMDAGRGEQDGNNHMTYDVTCSRGNQIE